jgi:hypothetical protein
MDCSAACHPEQGIQSMSLIKPFHKPNFFILGAAKCGTTTLYAYLKRHPDIFMSRVKEPTFFCEGFQVVKDPVEYFELFDGVKDERVIGEASHAYFSNPSSARVLKALFPEAKFVVILRNPADRAYSLYHHMRRKGDEKTASFEKALALEDERFASEDFRNHCPQYLYNFLYFRSGLFGEQVERYFSLFDRAQFHFMKLEYLRTKPLEALKDVTRFLDISTDFTPGERVRNEGAVTARYPFVQYLWNHKVKHPEFVRKLGFKILSKVNFMEIPRIRPDTRATLLERYEIDQEKLKTLTGLRF